MLCVSATSKAGTFSSSAPPLTPHPCTRSLCTLCTRPLDGDANCYSRAQGDLGSSKNYPILPPNVAPDTVGYEGASLFSSAFFANATIAYAKYCDGGSWAGHNSTPTHFNSTRLYYMGRPLLDALFADLMPRGLATARSVLYSGCSAGGLTAYTHIDYLSSLLSPSTVLLGLADAMFALHVPAFPGPGHTTYLEGMYQFVFTNMNASASLNQKCLAHYGAARGNECLYGAQVAPFVQTPMLVVNSRYDTWQEKSVVGIDCEANVSSSGGISLCPPGMEQQGKFWVAYGDTLAAAASALPPRHGVFLTNCPVHCQTGTGFGDPSTGAVATLGEAVDRWWPEALAHGKEPGWAAPRFIALDADECVQGPPSLLQC